MAMIGKILRMHHRDKKSVREIVRATSLSRNTVRKYLRMGTAQPPHRRAAGEERLRDAVGLLMKALVAALSFLWVGPACAIETVGPPAEVAAFLERREACDHWRSELGYDEERQADIDWAICQTCPGTDAQLARLKKKYAMNRTVAERLSALEPNIETKDKAAARRFCSKTRKPSSQQ